MNILIESLYFNSPNAFQNIFVTGFNLKEYFKRKTGKYHEYLNYYNDCKNKSLNELRHIQYNRLMNLIMHAKNNSDFYKDKYKYIDYKSIRCIDDLNKIPILEKEELRQNLQNIYTIKSSSGIKIFTGGTTGKSIQVIYTKDNFKERMAILDSFRFEHGYKIGGKTAWFSGRKILNETNEAKKIYWKYDLIFKIRYYSTFHLLPDNIKYYVNDLNSFRPSFICGFPSAINEISKYIIDKNIKLSFSLSAIFTTSETLTKDMRANIEKAFGSKVFNQYASAEGAPFITECAYRKLHYVLPSGIIEVIDSQMNNSNYGEILVTSFTTYGTPLIRYKIGDVIKLSENKFCTCGCVYPVVDCIEGRDTDFIYSKERGKIFNSQVGDCVKADINGIKKFQVVQTNLQKIIVKMIVDGTYHSGSESIIRRKFHDRLGNNIDIEFQYVEQIQNEPSGKYKLIKNEIVQH